MELKRKHWILLILIAFIAGLFSGILSSPTIQQPDLLASISLILAGVAGLLIGQAIGVVDLIRNYLKDREEKQSQPSVELHARIWTIDHPIHTIHANSKVLSLQVTNNGGGKDVQGCIAKIQIDEVINYQVATHWLYRDRISMFITKEIDAQFLQQQYLAITKDTIPSLRHGDSEDIDLLFTTDQHQEAYVLDVDRHRLQFGRDYTITVTIMTTNIKATTTKFKLTISSWEKIELHGIPLV